MLDGVVSCAGEWKHVLVGLNEVTGRSASVMMNKSTGSNLGKFDPAWGRELPAVQELTATINTKD